MRENSVAIAERYNRESEKLWGAYRERLLGYIRARVDAGDAEDVLQDVLLKAWQGLGKLKEEAKLTSWLYQITRNAIVDYYRSRVQTEPISEEALSRDEETGRAEQELATCLTPMIELLPEKYGRAVRLAEIEGRKGHEIARSEGITPSGAKSRVQRGRAMLRNVLEECCRVELDTLGRVSGYDPQEDCSGCDVDPCGPSQPVVHVASISMNERPPSLPPPRQ